MKTIQRAWALLCALVLLVSAVPLMPVVAENTTTGISLEFTVDNTTPAPGEIVTMSVTVDGMSTDDYWNLLEFEVGYDTTQLEPVMQTNEYDETSEYTAGASMQGGVASVSFKDYTGAVLNPIKAAVISSQNLTKNGMIMQIQFKVKGSVGGGEKITLTPELKNFTKSVISNMTSTEVSLVDAKTETLVMTAADSSLPETCPISFSVDKTSARVGEYITLTMTLDDLPDGYWNLLDFEVGYDADKLEPVMQTNEYDETMEYAPGAALSSGSALVSISFKDYNNDVLNPLLGSIISSDNVSATGDILSIQFKVKTTAQAGDTLVLTPTVNRFARSVIEDDRSTMVDMSRETETSLYVAVKDTLVPPEDSPITFSLDKTSVSAGDLITLTMTLDELPVDYWNLLDFEVGYDADKVEPVMQTNEYDETMEYIPGKALPSGAALVSVSFKDYNNEVLNPLMGSVISSANVSAIGDILSIQFKVKDTVAAGDTIEISPCLNQFAQSIIENGTSTLVDITSKGGVDLSVQVREIAGIAMTTAPAKIEYTAGESLDITGGKVTVTYDDNTTETVDLSQATVTGFDPDKVGTQTLTVTYNGKTTTFDVTVKPAYMLGDVNQDKSVKTEDALLALQIAIGKVTPSETQLLAGNVDTTEGVKTNDALLILQYAIKKITVFPIEQ